ncbi:hypothetical protein [Pseudoalteromonas sp.]|uniref:hypothetical protein n=1 Tax=Pseudoalteromonas sp. TaxID=53249 RepID=UPI00356A9932
MKKNNLLLALIHLVLLLTAASSFAKARCELPPEANQITIKRYLQCLDSTLNNAKQLQASWIEKRRYELAKRERETGDSQILQLFTNSITSHNKYVAKSCQWRYLLHLPNAVNAAINYKRCEIQLVEQFTASLKQPL